MFTYDPPGKIDDLAGRPSRAGFLTSWHKWTESQIRDEIRKLQNPPIDPETGRQDFPVPSPLFFTEVDGLAQSTGLPVPWNGFPLKVDRKYQNNPADGWSWLDTLQSTTGYSPDPKQPITVKFRPQDEYCEWHKYDNSPLGPRIVFTAEGPEYWIKLAEHDIKRVVELYQLLVSPEVREEDLLLDADLQYSEDWRLPAGSYNPFNTWNTEKGLIHLTHPANTLGAEINLAARATVLRRDAAGKRITDSRRLIASSGYGSVNRSSDPNIGFGVNITAVPVGATKPLSITLTNPVGLYMDDVTENRITDDKDRPLVGWFKFVRGTKGHGLMAALKPPKGDVRTLNDVYVDGEKLTSGAQVARFIQMVVYAATADHHAPMSPLHPPFYRACVSEGTDITDLANVNLIPGYLPDQTCRVQGALENPPLALDDAYPELFQPPGPALVAGAPRRSLTRNA